MLFIARFASVVGDVVFHFRESSSGPGDDVFGVAGSDKTGDSGGVNGRSLSFYTNQPSTKQ